MPAPDEFYGVRELLRRALVCAHEAVGERPPPGVEMRPQDVDVTGWASGQSPHRAKLVEWWNQWHAMLTGGGTCPTGPGFEGLQALRRVLGDRAEVLMERMTSMMDMETGEFVFDRPRELQILDRLERQGFTPSKARERLSREIDGEFYRVQGRAETLGIFLRLFTDLGVTGTWADLQDRYQMARRVRIIIEDDDAENPNLWVQGWQNVVGRARNADSFDPARGAPSAAFDWLPDVDNTVVRRSRQEAPEEEDTQPIGSHLNARTLDYLSAVLDLVGVDFTAAAPYFEAIADRSPKVGVDSDTPEGRAVRLQFQRDGIIKKGERLNDFRERIESEATMIHGKRCSTRKGKTPGNVIDFWEGRRRASNG